ncbi:MAG: RelA/SpoT domain-containing protein [Acidimicrobiia bacterium]|nr:RelA/SpoT domain-containing protein [Acidimicrobiia bacterium]
MSASPENNEIGYAAFGEWYDSFRAQVLEPALAVAEASLERGLSDLLSDRDLTRIRSSSGRVKSKRRTWRKIHHPRYEGQVTTVDDIAGSIDDLVGLRLTCINLRDIDMIQTALDALPRVPGRGLWLDPASVRDYVAEPKASGYRGWHVNLGIEVGDTPVVCELQVRSLLQDSWGELTHEETYSKAGALPPLVDVLSTRMADLLSILDDIAEDLRTELDRIDQEAVAGPDDRDVDAADVLAGQAADAAALLRGRWMSIDRPTDLAALAWALQREFGAEISDDWFGHGSFKRFLHHAVPEGEISTGRQAYLLPMAGRDAYDGATPSDPDHDDDSERPDVHTAPGPARQLRRIDPAFPLLSDTDWPILFEHLAESWRRVKPVDATAGTVNRLTRSARDLARAAGASLSRRTLDYVVKALLATDETPPVDRRTLSSQVLADMFAAQTIQRMIELRILGDASSKAAARVERWIARPLDP